VLSSGAFAAGRGDRCVRRVRTARVVPTGLARVEAHSRLLHHVARSVVLHRRLPALQSLSGLCASVEAGHGAHGDNVDRRYLRLVVHRSRHCACGYLCARQWMRTSQAPVGGKIAVRNPIIVPLYFLFQYRRFNHNDAAVQNGQVAGNPAEKVALDVQLDDSSEVELILTQNKS
jgi:hypothetical protein